MQYMDIDVYGRQNINGSPVEYFGVDAIKNSFNAWLTLNKGEILMNPSEGGALDSFVFKTLSDPKLTQLKIYLITEITKKFGNVLNLSGVELIPDYSNRLLEIQVNYSIPSENVSQSVSIYIDSNLEYQKFEYEAVSYTGQNLLEFFTIKKPSIPDSRLIFDYSGNFWRWNRFKLINLQPTDPYFEQILIIANGS